MSKPFKLTFKLALGAGVLLCPLAIAFVGGALYFNGTIARIDQSSADLEDIRRAFEASRAIADERTEAARLVLTTGDRTTEPADMIEAMRDRVDHAVAELGLFDRPGKGWSDDPSLSVSIGRLRVGLVRARAELDQTLKIPGHETNTAAITRMINAFADVSDSVRLASERIVVRLGARRLEVAPAALSADALDTLSTVMLDMALQVIPQFVAHAPQSELDRLTYTRLRERLLLFWQSAVRDMTVYGDAPAIQTARNQVSAHLWHDTADMIDRSLEFGRSSGDYRVPAKDLLDASDATALLIDRLRSVVLDQAAQDLSARRAEVNQLRLACLVIFCAALGTAIGFLAFVWRRVLDPLLMAGKKIRALARLEPVGAVASPTGQPEIAAIFESIEDLFIVLEERAEHTQQLKQLAETDGLTGLMNRRLLDRIGDGAIEFDSLPRAVSVILMDLDRFKSINDTYGHTSGDLVLRHAARLAQRVCRKSDLVARYGGEEIAIVIFDQDPWVAPHVAERVRAELEGEPIRLEDGRLITVTASFGVAHGRRGGSQWLDVLNGADEALYRAKGNGRNCVCTHDATPGAPTRKVA